MMQYKIPIIILIILLLIGVGFYFFRGNNYGSLTSDYSSNQTNDNYNYDFYGDNQAGDKTPPVINVSDATAEFTLNQYTGYGKMLSYVLQGPKLTLSSNKNGAVGAVIEVYDDANKLVTTKNVDSVYLQKGNQVVTIPSGVTLANQGKYSIRLKLVSKGDEKELFSKKFENMLVGITSYPFNKSVIMELFDIKHTGSSSDFIWFSIKTKNNSNSDIIGYYKIETLINGHSSNSDLRYGLDDIGLCAVNIWAADHVCDGGRIFVLPGKEYISDYATTEGEYGVVSVFDCKKGDSIDVKVSFYDSIENSPTLEGKVLGTVNLPRQTCLSS